MPLHPDPTPQDLSEAFWSVAGRLRHTARATLAPLDLSPSHARALGVLDRHGLIRLSELSGKLRIAPRSATEVVDALQERGLVERRPDARDRRATLVALTEDGVKAAQAINAARSAEAVRFFEALTDTDRAQLARILAKLAEQTQPPI